MKFTGNLQIASLFLLVSLVIAACDDCIEGNGKMGTRTVRVNDITAVKLNLSADVTLVPDSAEHEIVIEGESNIIKLVTIEQNAGRVRIGSEPCISTHKELKIKVPVSTLKDLQLNGSGNINSAFKVKTDDLELGINGSGNLDLDVDAQHIESQINGSGNILLKGTTVGHRIMINGSGNVEAENLASAGVKVTVNGSGDCKVLVTNDLEAIIRGSGNVYYSGSPKVQSEIKGSGSVERNK